MNKLTRKFQRASAALLAAALAAPAPAEAVAKPALWKVGDPDTTIYLFGTIHLLPKNTQWRTPLFDRSVTDSSELVIETRIDDKNPGAAIATMMKLAVSPNLPPLVERVPAAKRAALEAAIKKAGVPAGALDKFETWAAALLLVGVEFADLNLDPGSGVEPYLKGSFEAARKPVGELESNAAQFGFFDSLSEPAQRRFLLSVLEAPSAVKKQFDDMLGAWSRGDVAALERSFNKELEKDPELRAKLLLNRNSNWTRWIRARLDRPGTVLVAVGAGHLAGSGSVIDNLKRQGLKVTRVQ